MLMKLKVPSRLLGWWLHSRYPFRQVVVFITRASKGMVFVYFSWVKNRPLSSSARAQGTSMCTEGHRCAYGSLWTRQCNKLTTIEKQFFVKLTTT